MRSERVTREGSTESFTTLKAEGAGFHWPLLAAGWGQGRGTFATLRREVIQ